MVRHMEALRKLLCDILKISAGCVVRGQKENLNLSGEVFFPLNMMIGALSSEFCSSFQELRKQKW